MSVRAIDTATGEVIALPGAEQVVALRQQVERLEEELELQRDLVRTINTDNRRKQARITELTGERNQADELDPYWNQAIEVYEYWKPLLCPGSTEMGKKRWAVLRARLAAGMSVETLCKAVDGAALMPKGVKGRASMVKLEYICRHPDHVEGFVADAEKAAEVPTSTPLRVVGPTKELREAFLAHPGAMLASRHGDPVRATGFCMECALEHREGVATLDDGVLHCSNGCAHDVQAKALLDWYRHSGLVRCGECGARKAAA